MPNESKTLLRLFCAVELPEEVRERVGRYVSGLRAGFPKVRASWERVEKLHLTIKFVGEVEPPRAAALSEASARAAASVAPFPVTIADTGAFPPKGPTRVLWLGVRDEADGLQTLWRRLEDECHAAGFPREARPFRPHLTVARLRDPAGAGQLAEEHRRSAFEAASFRVSELVVVRSELGPAGSRHTPLSRHALAAG